MATQSHSQEDSGTNLNALPATLEAWSAPARTEKEEVIKIRLVENVFEGSHAGGKESVD